MRGGPNSLHSFTSFSSQPAVGLPLRTTKLASSQNEEENEPKINRSVRFAIDSIQETQTPQAGELSYLPDAKTEDKSLKFANKNNRSYQKYGRLASAKP